MSEVSAPARNTATADRFAAEDYVELTMRFKFNLKCEHCMIEGTMDWLKPESMAQFEHILALNVQQRRWKGLILTGSAVTMRGDFDKTVQGLEKLDALDGVVSLTNTVITRRNYRQLADVLVPFPLER